MPETGTGIDSQKVSDLIQAELNSWLQSQNMIQKSVQLAQQQPKNLKEIQNHALASSENLETKWTELKKKAMNQAKKGPKRKLADQNQDQGSSGDEVDGLGEDDDGIRSGDDDEDVSAARAAKNKVSVKVKKVKTK